MTTAKHGAAKVEGRRGRGEASQESLPRSDKGNSVDLFLFRDCKVYEMLVLKGCCGAVKMAGSELRSVFHSGMMAAVGDHVLGIVSAVRVSCPGIRRMLQCEKKDPLGLG